ncbi:hypothetical protein GCQ56_08740 [Marinifilum sp. N1E240]|uniref:HEAT repeat domain-containing protein n=1 Tax=Marinifilum sp. N1E240 TaxID=2608082 RepID=UPI00128DBE60|nr:zf-HC2 domain-containing protein [Marinifilum sp. N1E240]MPQ47102.1 hypothetical protein [Marinifilum sp. N1E240]
MECKYINDLLVEYIENDLNETQTKEVENHLTSCEHCRNEYELTKQFLSDINTTEDELPSSNLKKNFNQILKDEKMHQNVITFKTENKNNGYKFGEFLKYAALIIIIFGIGVLLGKNMGQSTDQSLEIAKLQNDLNKMNQNLTLATLKQPTSSQRLKAVNQLEEHSQGDDKVLAILVQTLQSDANVNVRMAAANALVKFANNPLVKNAFLEALKNQKEPSLQITLINILVNLQDERAKDLLQDILTEEDNLPVVRELAKEGIKVFI